MPWKEEEVGVILQDLQRYKLSLNLMLTIVQWRVHLSRVTKYILILLTPCSNRAAEANKSLDRLHDLFEQIAESNFETSVQLREFMSRPGQHYVLSIYAALTSEENAHDDNYDGTISSTVHVGSSLASGSTVHSDQVSIRTNTTAFSIRSVRSIIPSFTDELLPSIRVSLSLPYKYDPILF